MTDITTLRDALQELVDRDCRVFDRTLEIAFESNDRATGPSRRAGAQAVSAELQHSLSILIDVLSLVIGCGAVVAIWTWLMR